MTAADPSKLQAVLDRLDAQLEQSVERLADLLAIPSISTDQAYALDCRHAAQRLSDDLNGQGFEARVVDTPEAPDGRPMVLGHQLGAKDANKPHVLFYGHYDVQPVDPIELWDHDPFAPRVETRADGSKFIHGRGASDDKGQLMTFLEACRAWKDVAGALPIAVTVLLEGEEETGSPSMEAFLDRFGEEARADVALVCDTTMWDAQTPAITTSLRGLVGEEITLSGPARDLHSGFYGGAACNPLHVLTRALADLHDETGAVTLEGFYEGVPETPEEVKALWRRLGFDEAAFLNEVGLKEAAGEPGRSALEHIWTRPTCEINGVSGGYTGEGFKTVIPSKAHAKVSFRLVGTQDPHKIRSAFRAHMRKRLPKDCTIEFAPHGGAPALFAPYDSPYMTAAREALEDEWERPAALIGCGGSIPIVGAFKNRLGMDSMLIGFALEDDRIHAPNEKYELRSFHQGARSWARILAALAAL